MNVFEWISETKTFKKLDESFSSQVSNLNPDTVLILLNIILWAVIIFVAVFWIVKIYKLWKAPGSDLIQKYKENLRITSEDSEQKSIILTLMNQVNVEVIDLIEESSRKTPEEIADHSRKVIDLIIEQIPLSLKSTKKVNHRCAVFVPDDINPSELKILEGCGYSIKGKQKLRLKIADSIAGKVFTTGEYKYIKDLSKNKDFKPHPKATKNYSSLLCYPIKINGVTIGVLSIDGSEVNCFNKDDISYFKMFSNQIGIIFSILNNNGKEEIKGGDGSEVQNTG